MPGDPAATVFRTDGWSQVLGWANWVFRHASFWSFSFAKTVHLRTLYHLVSSEIMFDIYSKHERFHEKCAIRAIVCLEKPSLTNTKQRVNRATFLEDP